MRQSMPEKTLEATQESMLQVETRKTFLFIALGLFSAFAENEKAPKLVSNQERSYVLI